MKKFKNNMTQTRMGIKKTKQNKQNNKKQKKTKTKKQKKNMERIYFFDF